MKILLNGGMCLKCGETVYSRNRHDFKYCKCQAIAVDGGHDYLRRLGGPEVFQEASAYESREDKGGECVGMYLIYSSQGTSNPSTVFCRKEEAIITAEGMKKSFGGAWYVAGPMEEVK